MRPALAAASIVGAAYLLVCLAVLAWGFPNEDALILFKYANNVAHGEGVVYFAGGPHAEGATDFLWMLALAGARRAGVDVGVAAAILNAIGAGACAAMFLGRKETAGVLQPLALGWLLVSPPAVAGYVGFGTMAFSAIALWIFLACAEGGPRAIRLVPLAALVLALVRPDGAILGAGFVLVALHRAEDRRAFALRAFACGAVGAAYFVLRARYFGEWLPLPMYVKRHFHGLPGLPLTIDWILSVVPALVALSGLAALARKSPASPWLVAFAPLLVHVLSFAGAVQSQNVANRFQAPATVALACVACRLAGELPRVARPWRVLAAGLVLSTWLPGALAMSRVLGEAFRGDYIEAFAPALPRDAAMRIATTEAGNLPYWVDAEVLDLVGLNTKDTAREPPSRALLERFAPDLLLVHPAGGLDRARLARDHPDVGRAIVRLDAPLAAYVLEDRAGFYASALPRYRDLHAENVIVAPIVTFAFLDAHAADYDVYLAPARTFGGLHVIAVRRAWKGRDEVVERLVETEALRRRPPYLRAVSWQRRKG